MDLLLRLTADPRDEHLSLWMKGRRTLTALLPGYLSPHQCAAIRREVQYAVPPGERTAPWDERSPAVCLSGSGPALFLKMATGEGTRPLTQSGPLRRLIGHVLPVRSDDTQ